MGRPAAIVWGCCCGGWHCFCEIPTTIATDLYHYWILIDTFLVKFVNQICSTLFLQALRMRWREFEVLVTFYTWLEKLYGSKHWILFCSIQYVGLYIIRAPTNTHFWFIRDVHASWEVEQSPMSWPTLPYYTKANPYFKAKFRCFVAILTKTASMYDYAS